MFIKATLMVADVLAGHASLGVDDVDDAIKVDDIKKGKILVHGPLNLFCNENIC